MRIILMRVYCLIIACVWDGQNTLHITHWHVVMQWLTSVTTGRLGCRRFVFWPRHNPVPSPFYWSSPVYRPDRRWFSTDNLFPTPRVCVCLRCSWRRIWSLYICKVFCVSCWRKDIYMFRGYSGGIISYIFNCVNVSVRCFFGQCTWTLKQHLHS